MKSSKPKYRNEIETTLHLDHFLHRKSFFFFVVFFSFTLWAFWTSYYGKLSDEMPAAIRFHGTTMTLWCLLLIVQPLLIRLRKNKIHRWLGMSSYLIVPFILVSGAHLAHITIQQSEQGSSAYYYMIALMFNSLIVFAILYGLAIRHRKNAVLHSRYMISTVFPLFTPVTDRIIYKYVDSLVPLAPTIEGMPVVPAFGFGLANAILIFLLLWDWFKHRRLTVFPVVLGILLLYHLSVMTFYKYDFWKKIGDGIMSIPFS